MKFHEELNPKIWEQIKEKHIGGATNYMLKLEVSEKLNEIADAFINFLEIPKDSIQDIRILGSSASYNYTEHSDLDLHLVIDYDKVHEDCPLVNGYLWAYKSIFNEEHDISIYGIPVEVYAEPTTESAISNGVYSLISKGWIKFPEKIEPTDNDAAVQSKYKELKEACDKCDDSEVAEKLYDKIYSMRKAGLAKGGEFSTENMAFKLLRNDGCLDRLRELKKAKIDKELTLERHEHIVIDFYSNDTLIKNFILSKGSRYIRVDLISHDDEVIGYFHINKDNKSIIDNHIVADTEVLKNYLTPAREERILNYIRNKLNKRSILENIEMSLEDFKKEFGSYTLEHTSNPFSKDDEIDIYKGDRHIGQYLVADKELVMYENYKGNKTMKKRKLNEEYGPLQGEPYMEEIAHDLEIGSTYRDTDEYSWSLLIDGMEIEESISSNEVLEWLLQEISYPVRDGHDYYNGLNLILDKDRFDYEDGQIAHDLERLGFDTKLFEEDDEIQTWIDYDLNLEVHENEDDMEENYKGNKTMKKRMNEEEKYLSDEDIAAQYEDFKCTSIEVKPSKVNEGWYNFTLELEFPDASHPDFNNYVIENGYYDSVANSWGFDNWYPEETSEKLKEMVLAEIKKVAPKTEETDIEALQRIGSKDYAIYRNNKTGEFFVDKAGVENPKPAYKKVFGSEEELKVWAKEVGLAESYKGKKTMKKKINEDAKIIANLYNDFKPWSGAVATWEKITDADMLEDLDRLLEEMYPDGIGMTELNDLLWFEDEWVLEQLGLAETEDEVEESLKPSRKSSRKMNENNLDTIWTYLVDYGIATDEEISLVTTINGYTEEALNDIIYARTGMRDFEQLQGEDEEEYDESFNENDEVKNAIALYKKQGFLDTEDEEDAKAIEVLKNADYTVKVNSRGTAHVIELERMGESLKPSRRRKSVNEISDELAQKVAQKRQGKLDYAKRKFGKEINKDRFSKETLDAENKYHNAIRKKHNNDMIMKKRQTQSESLAESILKSAHEVLAMNESSEAGDMTTWQFSARGFSKASLNKQSTFGSNNVRCVIHENENGKLVGTATVDYYMSKQQVEEALIEALRENGFRTTAISELINLY